MFPPRDPNNPGTQYSLTTASFAFITPMEETIIIVNGAPPQPFVSLLREGDAIEAIANESLANEFGVQVGDTYSLRTDNGQIPGHDCRSLASHGSHRLLLGCQG
jgi:hypothetical protein